MKAINLAGLASIIIAVICFSMLAVTPSCASSSSGSIDKEKAVAVANIALDYAVSADKLPASDAALIREALNIVAAGSIDKSGAVAAANSLVIAAEKSGKIAPERAAQIRMALSLLM